MPTTAPCINPALISHLNSGDEHAFERLFREQYPVLLDEALPLLAGDGASAARGVESVLTEVWRGREDFTTPAMLEAYLHEAVHEAAARIKSRHAVAHHLSEYDGGHAQTVVTRPAPTVDEAWSRMTASLHVSDADAAQVAHQLAEHSRHEAAGHLADIAKPAPRSPMIVMGVLLFSVVGGLLWWVSRSREAAELTSGLAASDARAMATGSAEFSNVTLADHSTVKLGPDSKLVIPRGFGTSIRGLKLDGTATFTVAPGQKRRFIVRAGGATVAATGTAFSVRAYPEERDITVRVTQGDVTATASGGARPLAAGTAIVIGKDGAMRAPAASELDQSLGWTDGTVVVADRPLREVVVLAKRWFGLDLFVPDSALLDRKVTLRAKLGMATEAVASIESSGGLRKVWEGSNMVLKDNATKRP
jgi:ferric-dicitrate binding protein FerR (iron transport regulator)